MKLYIDLFCTKVKVQVPSKFLKYSQFHFQATWIDVDFTSTCGPLEGVSVACELIQSQCGLDLMLLQQLCLQKSLQSNSYTLKQQLLLIGQEGVLSSVVLLALGVRLLNVQS